MNIHTHRTGSTRAGMWSLGPAIPPVLRRHVRWLRTLWPHTLWIGGIVLLAGCGAVDNRPAPRPLGIAPGEPPPPRVWQVRYSDSDNGRFAFQPDTTGDAIYMAGVDGYAGFLLDNGKRQVKVSAPTALSSGLGAQNSVVLAATLKGKVYAWEAHSGELRWEVQLGSGVIVPPILAQGLAVLRGLDGTISALDLANGQVRWQLPRTQPTLILRQYAPPLVRDGQVLVNQAGGRLSALALADGHLLWEGVLAEPQGATELERLNDLAASPVADGPIVCAVSFQGRVGCFDRSNGTLLWSREASAYTGLALDGERLYLSDADSNLLAFDRGSGRVLWKQEALYGRRISGPALWNGRLVVGDYQGWLHWIDPNEGKLVARAATDGSAVRVPPRVLDDKLWVQTSDGHLIGFDTH